MSNLVRIEDVRLYIAYTDGVTEGVAIKKYLDDHGIPYVMMSYTEVAQHASVLEGLGTWSWGRERTQREFKDFPVITWDQLYDDFTRWPCCATTLQEFQGTSVAARAVEIRAYEESVAEPAP